MAWILLQLLREDFRGRIRGIMAPRAQAAIHRRRRCLEPNAGKRYASCLSATPTSDRTFELWAMAPGATQPRSLGVISPNGELKLSRLPADLRDGATLAISIEPIGGSPTQLPSGPVVYIGSVKAV